jgi:DNA-binding NarL/FixJ family response regulator
VRLGSILSFPELTERELEILHLISPGRNNSEIAQKLVLSPITARNHTTGIFGKLQVADRAQVLVKALAEDISLPLVS